jgi:hypothetical protein
MKIHKTFYFLFSILLFGIFPFNVSGAQSSPEMFLENLRLGSVSRDVVRLQKFLNTHGFQVATSGPGSIGFETVSYGTLTKNAVSRFQEKYKDQILKPQGLVQPTGRFFKATRDVANQIIKDQKKLVAVRPANIPATTTITTVRPASVQSVSGPTVPTYTVTITSSSSNQQISPNSVQTVNEGSTVSFTVTPNTGYINNQVVGGTCQTGSWNGNTYTTGVVTAHCVLTFSTLSATYTITSSFTGGLTVNPYPTSTVTHGSTKAYVIGVSTGEILSRQVGGTCPQGFWAHSIFSTGAVTTDCTVSFSTASASLGSATSFVGSGNLYIKQANGDFQYSTNNSDWTTFGWPLTIANVGPSSLIVRFVGDFTIIDSNQYFVVNSDDIVFRGEESGLLSPSVFKISGVSNYPGLFQNGTNLTNGFNNTQISNIFIDSDGSTLSPGSGWLAQSYFGNGVTSNSISNCGSNGTISTGGGGIVGSYSMNLTISKCFSTGQILTNAGGIVGSYSNSVTVSDSYSTGILGITAGGIIGPNSIGPTVSSSYSQGLIGSSAGGIVGPYSSSPIVINTYSTGAIFGGGIIGLGTLALDTQILHSYTSGAGTGGGSGIIQDVGTDGITNYAETNHGANGWNPVNAAATLTGVGTTWTIVSPSTPYQLAGFNIVPYATSTLTLSKGSSTEPAYSNYSMCVILKINNDNPTNTPGITIDSDTGIISISNTATNGLYDVRLSCNTAQGGYTLPVLNLTVTD